MTVGEALRWAQRELSQASGGDAAADARLFVCSLIGDAGDRLLLRLREPLARQAELAEMIARRRAGEPAQYIVGSADFMGIALKCDPRSLIPRFETELLAMQARHTAQRYGIDRALDLCTGSGCLSIDLARAGLAVDACDVSGDALALARDNARRAGVNISFYQGDLFDALAPDAAYPMIVSNPPYIRTRDISGLAVEVRAHEPRIALDGGEDGLVFYRRIAEDAPAHLLPRGWLLLEVGEGQAQQVAALLKPCFESIEIRPDLRGIDRVVKARRRE